MKDVVLVLKLGPQETGRGKVEDDFVYVIERAGEVWNLDWRRWPVEQFDAVSHRGRASRGESSDLVLARIAVFQIAAS